MKIPKSNFSEWYNTIIKEAELCDLRYNLKGFIVFMPWAVLSMDKMYSVYEKEMQKRDHVPALFPALINEANLKSESEHVEGFIPEVFWVTEAGGNKLEEKYAMRPTSETAMYPMYALWVKGLKDLPIKLYQRCQVWRYETKATKPFIRSREFHWIEAHNAFATEKEALDQIKEDMEISEELVHKQFGVPFLFFRRPQWDKFAGAVDTYAADSLMPDGKVLQLPSTHFLGQNFAKAFKLQYMDEKGNQEFAWQTCYGPCISRIYAAIFSTHGDDKGLVLPFDIAPVQIVIVPIFKENNKSKVLKKAKEIKESLKNYSVKLDDSDNSPGFKFNHWELKGVPFRIEIGERDMENSSVILVRRDELKKNQIKEKDLLKTIEKESQEMIKNLRSKSDKWFKELIHSADSIKDLNNELKKGGFVKIPFCTDQDEGEKCADKIKEETKSNVRGTLYGSKDSPKNKKCIACGKKAVVFVYTGRQY